MDPQTTDSAGPPTPTTTTPAPLVTTPASAQHGDKIEVEWVVKLRQILKATANDPHTQNRQLALLRADYMQKRYNKQVPLGD